jgi:hypothetical protein
LFLSELDRVKRLLHEREREAAEALRRQQQQQPRDQREAAAQEAGPPPPMDGSVFGSENSLFGADENRRLPADIPLAAAGGRRAAKEPRPLQGFFEV